MIGLKDQCFGVEVEMTGITREQAAQALANYFGTTPRYKGGTYDAWVVRDAENKEWKLMSDGSIHAERKTLHGYEQTNNRQYMRIFSSTVPPPGTSGVIKIGEPNGMRIPVWNWVRMMIPWSSLLPGAASRQFWRPFRESTRTRLSPTAGQTRTLGAMWERLYTKTEK